MTPPSSTDAVAASGREAQRGLALSAYLPHALIFFSSACIMVVELVAGRLVARHLGSSLYTWTSIIGVVLAGMSVGNMLGGRLADRFRPRALLGWLFIIASAACLLTLSLNAVFVDDSPLKNLAWPTRVFLTMFFIFLVPALALGTISPVTAKMALEQSSRMGKTIGSVYAWGAVGSIIGTFATGFWLIATLGVQGVVMVISLGLGLVGLLLGPRRWLHLLWLLVVIALVILARIPSAGAVKYSVKLGLKDDVADCHVARDSNYQLVKVYDKQVDDDAELGKKRMLRVLALDYLIHGYIDPADPSYLHYDYERVYAAITRELAGERRRLSAFFIGGGSYTFPRWLLSQFPGSTAEVAEIDPLVIEANHLALALPRDTPIRTHVLDGRNAVDDLPSGKRFDVIYGDAYSDLSPPAHLVTLEYTRKLARHLAPRGALLANVIDSFGSALFLCAMVETQKRVFPHVYVFATSRFGPTGGRDTFVVAGTLQRIDTSTWEAGHKSGRPGSALSASAMNAVARRCNGRVLTDDNAPVENLLLPVVRNRK